MQRIWLITFVFVSAIYFRQYALFILQLPTAGLARTLAHTEQFLKSLGLILHESVAPDSFASLCAASISEPRNPSACAAHVREGGSAGSRCLSGSAIDNCQ